MRPWLVLAAMTVLAFAAPARATGMMQNIFMHECEQANAANLGFTCQLKIEGGPVLIITRAKPELSKEGHYRENLLYLRYFEAGGQSIDHVDATHGTWRACSVGASLGGQIGLYCDDWVSGKPVEVSSGRS